MQVQMKYSLTSRFIAIHDHTIAIIRNTFSRGNMRRRGKQRPYFMLRI